MIKLLLICLLALPLFSIGQYFPVFFGEPNTSNIGQVYEMPNGKIIINNIINDSNNSSTGAYSKIITLNSKGNLIIEKNYKYVISNIHIYSLDSIYLIYPIYNEFKNNYLFVELVDYVLDVQNKDSMLIGNDYLWATKIFQHKDSICFFSNRLDSWNTQLTLGYINKEGSFNNNFKTINTGFKEAIDILINNEKEWLIFFSRNYIQKLDSNFNDIGDEMFTENGSDFAFHYDSFLLDERYFITGGTTKHNRLKVVKMFDYWSHRYKVYFEESHMGDRAGTFSNVAKADSFFYYVATKGMDTTDVNYAPGHTYVFVACLDFNLNIRWKKRFGGDAYYNVYSLCTTKKNECLVLASKDTIINNELINEVNELYLLKVNKYGNIVTSTPINKTERKALVYPNPGVNTMNFKLPETIQNANINLYNISGTKILSKQVNSANGSITTSHLPKGVYVYEIISNNQRLQGKWVKQ